MEVREREFHCCGQKIQYFLGLEHGIHLSVPKIYEILAEKYVIRSRWRKNRERGPIPQASTPREVVQMDSMDFGISTPSLPSIPSPEKPTFS